MVTLEYKLGVIHVICEPEKDGSEGRAHSSSEDYIITVNHAKPGTVKTGLLPTLGSPIEVFAPPFPHTTYIISNMIVMLFVVCL
jgi:hypothetical protein